MKPKNFRSLTDSAKKVMLGESVEEKPDQQLVVNEQGGPLHGIHPAMFFPPLPPIKTIGVDPTPPIRPQGKPMPPGHFEIAPGIRYYHDPKDPDRDNTYYVLDPETGEWLPIPGQGVIPPGLEPYRHPLDPRLK